MDVEADEKDIRSLQRLAKTCANILEALLLEENARAEVINAREGHWVSRQYAEFNLWCVKVGVYGQGLRSVDIRLKDVPETCTVIRDLLESLHIDLKQIQQPADRIQHSKKADVQDNHSDSASNSSSLSFDSLSSLDNTENRESNEDAPLEDEQAPLPKRHIEDTINRLHGHALQIDKAGARHRQERVKVYIEKDGPKFAYQGYREIAYRKAKVQFPLASDLLHHRVAESFARRRIRFDYLREHQKKRAAEQSIERTKLPVSRQPKSAPTGKFTRMHTAKEKEAPKTSSHHIEQHPRDQQTIYSATERTKLERPIERRQVRAESVLSIALRHSGFPPPPKITSHSFQCPYCRLDFRAAEAEKARWSQHVMQDFEPYFCPFEQCTKPFDFPNTFDDLLFHLQDHVEERFHLDLPEGEHQELSEDEFEKYITQRGHISDENLAVVKKAAQRKGAFIFENCPFCGGYPDALEKRFPVPRIPEAQAEMRRHIRQHMQDTALFLPPYRDDVFDDDNKSQSSVFSHEGKENDSLENWGDFRTVCDRDSCDCKIQSTPPIKLIANMEIQESESTGDSDAADLWTELFPGLPRFDRTNLTKEYCVHDDILRQFLTVKLRSVPELSSEGWDITPDSTQGVPESFPHRSRGEKRSTILGSLALDDYEILHLKYSRLRCPGTFQWLLMTDAFRTWLCQPSQTFSCYGFPGSGKTILTSAVVDHVVNYFADDETTGIAFVYCDQDKTAPGSGDDAQGLLMSILKQLAECLPSISSALEFLYNTRKVSSVPDSVSALTRIIERVVEGYSKTFIIVDAIDEIQEGPRGRTEFLLELVKLQKACGCNIFLTSRPIVDITQKLLFLAPLSVEEITKHLLSATSKSKNIPQGSRGSTQMDFCATDEDMRTLVQYRLPRLPYRIRRDPVLQRKLEQWIIDHTDGMLLLAQSRLDKLENQTNASDANSVDGDFWKMVAISCADSSSHSRSLFAKLSRRIRSHGDHRYSLVIRAMRLVFSSRRQLKAIELLHALSKSFLEPLEENRRDINDVLVACAGLVTIDDLSNTVSLSHYITEDFLQENLEGGLSASGETYLAAACMDCISSEAFDTGPCSTDADFRERLRSYPFYSYAASNWGHHAREASLSTSTVVDFLCAESTMQAAGQALIMSQFTSQQPHRIQNIPNNMSGLHLAAYFDLEKAVMVLLQNSTPDPRDSHHRTPLMYAAEQGHLPLCGLLINRGARVDARDRQGRTPLHLAALHSQYKVIDILVNSGADINAINDQYMSPLHMAAQDGDHPTVSRLLNRGADLNQQDYMGWTPLLRATMSGCGHDTIELLLRDGASCKDVDISVSAAMGYNGIVSTLLRNGAYVDTRGERGWTPLLHAVANGHVVTAQVLLSWGADVHTKEEDGWNPLLIATLYGHTSIVEELLFHAADIKSTAEGGYSPLLIAAYRGHDSIARLLCLHASPKDREAREKFGQTPLLVAVRHGHETVVEILLQNGSDIEARDDKFGQTPLLMAVRLGHKGIVRILLEWEAEIEATRFDGKNAIEIASVPERKEIYDLLIDRL